jgi:coupling of ubiquitin conjugation to ER degradation protein 1
MATDQDDQHINLPSLVVILVLSGLIIRYLFFSSPTAPGAGTGGRIGRLAGGGDAVALMRSREAAVERILQMFPQVERRTVLWDLQRTGGSVAATTERILAGRMETVSFVTSFFLLFSFPWWLKGGIVLGWLVGFAMYGLLADRMMQPPVSFQPPPPPGSSSSNVPTPKPVDRPVQPDLITRYNLKDKVPPGATV